MASLTKTNHRRLGLKALLGATLAGQLSGINAQPQRTLQPVGRMRKSGYSLAKEWDFLKAIRTPEDLRKEFFTRYIYNNGKLDTLNKEWSRYRDNDNHVFTPNGMALVARTIGELKSGNIESGMIRSKWTGKHGVYEIKMKVPRGLGLWPAFWLLPEDATWPPEIDVVEIVDNGRDTTKRSFHFLHGKNVKKAETTYSRLNRHMAYEPGFDYADDFHVFSVEWLPDSVRHYVDGVLLADRKYDWVHNDGDDAGVAHVIANLAVGGRWPGIPVESALPAQVEIQYIRVWK